MAGVCRYRVGAVSTTSCASSTRPGWRRTQVRVTHDVAGLRDLGTELRRFAPALPIAIERSAGLLVEHLQAAGPTLFRSRRASPLGLGSDTLAAVKDDRFDAFVLADTLHYEHAHSRPLTVPSPLLAEIRP